MKKKEFDRIGEKSFRRFGGFDMYDGRVDKSGELGDELEWEVRRVAGEMIEKARKMGWDVNERDVALSLMDGEMYVMLDPAKIGEG